MRHFMFLSWRFSSFRLDGDFIWSVSFFSRNVIWFGIFRSLLFFKTFLSQFLTWGVLFIATFGLDERNFLKCSTSFQMSAPMDGSTLRTTATRSAARMPTSVTGRVPASNVELKEDNLPSFTSILFPQIHIPSSNFLGKKFSMGALI